MECKPALFNGPAVQRSGRCPVTAEIEGSNPFRTAILLEQSLDTLWVIRLAAKAARCFLDDRCSIHLLPVNSITIDDRSSGLLSSSFGLIAQQVEQ